MPVVTKPPSQGKARASIHDVARLAGVSIATVSRALHGAPDRVAGPTKSRVLAAVASLDYHPNQIGRSLRTNRTGAVALLISDIRNSFYAAVALEIERQLNAIGVLMLLCNTMEDPVLQDQYLEELRAINVSAVLMLCAVTSPRLQDFVLAHQVIFINRLPREVPGVVFVGIDDFLAARDLGLRILQTQRGPIGIVHGPLYSTASENRLRGLTEVLAENRVAVPASRQVESPLSMEGGYQGFASLWRDNSDVRSVFCGSDQIAYGAYRRCRELGLRVPEDVRLYGFDDNPLNDWLAPWLDTVRVPHLAYATETVGLLKRTWEGHPVRSVLLPYDIVIRN